MRRLKQPASTLTIIKTKISALLVKARNKAIMSDLVKYWVFYNSVVEHSYFGCVKLLILTPVTSIVMQNCSLPSFAYFVVVHLWNVQIYKCAIDRVDLQSLLYCSNALKFEITVLLFHYLSLLCSSMAAKYTYFMWVYSVQSHWNMDFDSDTLFNVDMNRFVDSPVRYCPILHRL